MKVLFCAGTSILSKLIMWGLKEDCSHTAVLFDDLLVFHSNLLGIKVEWFSTFLKTHRVVHEIDFGSNLESDEKVYQSIITANDGKNYDYGAFFYFIFAVMRKKLFGIQLPLTNPWRKRETYLCTEVVELLPPSVVPKLNVDYSIVSPTQLFYALISTLNIGGSH